MDERAAAASRARRDRPALWGVAPAGAGVAAAVARLGAAQTPQPSLMRIAATPQWLQDCQIRADHQPEPALLRATAIAMGGSAGSGDVVDPSAHWAVPAPNPGQQSGGWAKWFPGVRRASPPWATPLPRTPGDVRSDTGEPTDPQRHKANPVQCLVVAHRRYRRSTVGSIARLELGCPGCRHGRGAVPAFGDVPTRRAR